jgi:hypothetical protein
MWVGIPGLDEFFDFLWRQFFILRWFSFFAATFDRVQDAFGTASDFVPNFMCCAYNFMSDFCDRFSSALIFFAAGKEETEPRRTGGAFAKRFF